MKRPFGIAGLIYLITASILLPYLQYYADNPDTFQYISIAKKYLQLDWRNAVNGYWSPLISWLLVVPVAVFDDSVTAFKMLQLAVGLFVLFQWCRIFSKSPLKIWLQYLLAIVSIPFLVSYAMLNCTPDLLFTGMIMWLINIFLSGNAATDPSVAFRAAVAGGFMYFTKAFGMPLFLAVSAVAIIFERRIEKTNFRSVAMMYMVFAAMCGVWIINISSHYGEFTISKAITFNRSLSPEALSGVEELPVLGSGIIKPADGQLSAWESPGEYVSANIESDYADILKRNVLSIYYFDFRRQAGIVFLLLLAMYVYRKGKELMNDKWLLLMLAALLFVYGGYSLILVHSRYLWINTFIMLAASLVFIQQLINNGYFKAITISVLLLIAVKRPVKEILFINDSDYPAQVLASAFMHPFRTLDDTYGIDSDIQKSIAHFQKIKLPKSNFASLKPSRYSRDTYATSLRIAESMDAVYFGEIKSPSGELSQLNGNIVDYLIAFEEVSGLRLLFYQTESGIRIYNGWKK